MSKIGINKTSAAEKLADIWQKPSSGVAQKSSSSLNTLSTPPKRTRKSRNS